MSKQTSHLKRLTSATIGAAILMSSISTVSFADQPRWANSHGYYQKHQRERIYHRQREDDRDERHQRPRVVYVERQAPYTTGRRARQNTGFGAEQGGTILGAILGAAVGTQFGKGQGRTVAILSGAVVGALFGGEIGRSMQASDRAQAQYTLETKPTGQPTVWQNPDTGSRYKMVPTRTYTSASNQNCRDYTTWAVIDGYEEQVHGTACRQSDGSWKQLKI